MRLGTLFFLALLSLCLCASPYQPIYQPNSQSKVTVRDSIREELNGVFQNWGPPIKSKSDIYKPQPSSPDSINAPILSDKDPPSSASPVSQEKRVVSSSTEYNSSHPSSPNNQPSSNTRQNPNTSIHTQLKSAQYPSQSTYIIVQQPNNVTQQYSIPPSSGNNHIILIVPQSTNSVNIGAPQNTTSNTPKTEVSSPQRQYLTPIAPLPTLPSVRQSSSNSKTNSKNISANKNSSSASNPSLDFLLNSNSDSSTLYPLNPPSSPQPSTQSQTQQSSPIYPLQRINLQSNNTQVTYQRVPVSNPVINQSLNNFLSLDNSKVPISTVAQTVLNFTQNNPVFILSREEQTSPTAAAQRAMNITSQMNTQQIIGKAQEYMKNNTLIFQRCQNNYLSSNKNIIYVPSYRKCLTDFESSLYTYYSVLINYQEVLSSFDTNSSTLTQKLTDIVKVMQSVQSTLKELNK